MLFRFKYVFLLSALSFFVSQGINPVALIIALLTLIALAAHFDFSKLYSSAGSPMKIFCALTALGVCVFSHQNIYVQTAKHPGIMRILDSLRIPHVVFSCGVVAASALSFLFVYICLIYFWTKFLSIIRPRKINRNEILFYSVLLAAVLCFVSVVFIRTNAFYCAENGSGINYYNAVYSADSGYLVAYNSFLNIRNAENDIRQPLFAVFSIPFIGLSYLVAEIFSLFAGHRIFFEALFMNYVQILMLFAGIFMLAKAMKLSIVYRVCFMLLFSCSYVLWLFSVMMEQYIIAFFWLALAVYCMCRDSYPESLMLHGAGGTLSTSLVITPFYGWGGGKLLTEIISYMS